MMPNAVDLGKEHWNIGHSLPQPLPTQQPQQAPPPQPPAPTQPSPTKPKRRGRSKVTCDLCGQLFHRYALYRHRREVHNPVEVTCKLCNTKFKSEEYRHRHMQYKHGMGKNLTCGTCNKTFRSEVKLKSHQCTGPSNTMVPTDPGKEYWNANYVDQKPKIHHDRVECEYCGKFFHIYAIYRHRRDVHNPIVCICPVCNSQFKSKEYLNRHMLSKHGISRETSTSTSTSATAGPSTSTSTNDATTAPSTSIANYTDEQKPKMKAVDQRRVECDQCGQYFHHYALYRHRRDVHNPIEISCEVCNTKFKSEEYLHRHMEYKHGVGRNLTCGTCNKTFRSKIQLDNHECGGITLPPSQGVPLKPEPEKNGADHAKSSAGNSITFACDICGKCLDCEQSLQKHKTVFHSLTSVPVWNPHWMPPIVWDWVHVRFDLKMPQLISSIRTFQQEDMVLMKMWKKQNKNLT